MKCPCTTVQVPKSVRQYGCNISELELKFAEQCYSSPTPKGGGSIAMCMLQGKTKA